eukprot:2665612-Pleurochrysis_carterae.AAC.1
MNNNEGIEQADNAVRALERPRRYTDLNIKKEEELALRQMISGIIPEWQEADDKKKKGVIAMLRSWTREMMNHARIQMKTWITIKNEHKAKVQYKWDNRANMCRAFQNWRERVGHVHEARTGV